MNSFRPGGSRVRSSRSLHLLLVLSLIVFAFWLGVSIHEGSHAWFAWVSLVPLFLAIRYLPPRKAFVSGAMWGLGIVLAALTTSSAHGFENTFTSLSLLAMVPAVYAFTGAILRSRIGFAPCLSRFFLAEDTAQ